jgi:PAS domain-containing protein
MAMYIDLILNLSLLVAISVVSSFLSQRWTRDNRSGAIIQGLLFGTAAVFGMQQPLVFGPGVIFDGRSVMLSLCSMFFGPWAAIPSVLLTGAYRMWLGGGGALMGVLVILSSSGIGTFFHYRWNPQVNPPSALRLYLFGIAVHTVMIGLISTLPENTVLSVLKHIGPPMIILFPLATVLAGKILSDHWVSLTYMEKLQASERKYKELVENANTIIIVLNSDGCISLINQKGCRLLGYTESAGFE